MYYIYETDKPNKILERLNIIKLIENKIVLPINEENITQRQAEKLAMKTNKILQRTNSKTILISKKIKKQEYYINYLNSYNIKIIDGKWLNEILSYDILEYITKTKKIKKEETQIAITINEITENMLQNIRKIVKDYKRVNIITNHISNFKNIENQILEKDGIMITVSNNKRKSLSKAKIILNIDFPTELINKYNIYEEAIIINLKGNVKINNKRFNGININDYEINYSKRDMYFEDYEILEKFANKDIYEALIYKRQPYQDVIKRIKKDKVEILKLFANKTEI